MMLPETRGKTYIIRVLSVYIDLFRVKYGFIPQVPISRWGAHLKRLMESKTELQIAALLIIFFDWGGMDGGDEWERKSLEKVTHNMGWFFNSVNKYEAYIRNVFGLPFDDEPSVRNFVALSMSNLK